MTRQQEVAATEAGASATGILRKCEAVREQMLERPCRATSAISTVAPVTALQLLAASADDDCAG